jgi:DNA processing protein
MPLARRTSALSVVPPTVPIMDETRMAGVILAALELAPGKPSDVTAILLSDDRHVLMGPQAEADGWSESAEPRHAATASVRQEATPLARYLADHIDQGRIEHWTKVVDRGMSEGRYRPLPVTDPGYPSRLREVWDAPPLLFHSVGQESRANARVAAARSTGYNGNGEAILSAARLDDALSAYPSVAIIGSRETSREVVEGTELVASDLAEAGISIISGLAAGVDAAAHRGALAACGYTVAVMGTGIDLVFPESNLDLATEVARSGTLVSQFVPPAPRTPSSFLLRNHVIAAMSDVTLVMDGDERSGSRYEVEQAVAYGRPVLAWAPALAHRSWVRDLVETGAARLVESAAQVREHLARLIV